MAETYPCRAALVEGGVVRAVVTCHSQANRDGYDDVAKTYTMEDAKTISLPQSLRAKIIDALRASQDAADLAEAGRRLMAKRLNGSGGAPDLGGPPAQLPPGPTIHPFKTFLRDHEDATCVHAWNAALCAVNDRLRGIDEPDVADSLKDLLYFGLN